MRVNRRELEIVRDAHADAERQPDEKAQNREEEKGHVMRAMAVNPVVGSLTIWPRL